MLKTERQEQILEILQKNKYLAPRDIADMLFTSYSSIRRDLEEMELSGLILRSYGKVELANNHPMLISYPIRMTENAQKKQLIAKKAASLIHEGDTIFIDPSSSCSYFAKELTNIKGITIVTNNIEILYYMTQYNVNVISSGGTQSEQNRYAMVGAIAENTFRNIYADYVIFSARSLTADGKIYDIHYAETTTRHVMLKNAAKKIFLCDSSKLNSISPYYQCDLSDIDYLICDTPSVKNYAKQFPNLNVL